MVNPTGTGDRHIVVVAGATHWISVKVMDAQTGDLVWSGHESWLVLHERISSYLRRCREHDPIVRPEVGWVWVASFSEPHGACYARRENDSQQITLAWQDGDAHFRVRCRVEISRIEQRISDLESRFPLPGRGHV